MDFELSTEQTMLKDALSQFLSDRYDFRTRQARPPAPSSWEGDVWQAFARELELLGAPFPERLGGIGGSAIENMIVMEELGKALSVEPWLQAVVIAGGYLRQCDDPAALSLLQDVIAGTALPAPYFSYARPELDSVAEQSDGYTVSGRFSGILASGAATHLLIPVRLPGDPDGSLSVFAVPRDAEGLSYSDYALVDGQRSADIAIENLLLRNTMLIGPRSSASPLIERALDEGTAALCAEAVGVLRALLEATVDYARQRRQFGRPIADFQVLQHRMADMFILLEEAISMTYFATLQTAAAEPQRRTAISAAKVKVNEAARFIGQEAVQIHGGMGMTQELAVAHLFTRATVIQEQYGSTDFHLERYAAVARRVDA